MVETMVKAIQCPSCKQMIERVFCPVCVKEWCEVKIGDGCSNRGILCDKRTTRLASFCPLCSQLLTIGKGGAWQAGIPFCTCSECMRIKTRCPDGKGTCIMWDSKHRDPCNCPIDRVRERIKHRDEYELKLLLKLNRVI